MIRDYREAGGERKGQGRRESEVVSITACVGNETVVAATNNRNEAKGLIHHSFELKQQLRSC